MFSYQVVFVLAGQGRVAEPWRKWDGHVYYEVGDAMDGGEAGVVVDYIDHSIQIIFVTDYLF